jgi:exodeoxyribonuclease-3
MKKKTRLRIASYNINGVTSRLPILLRWLDEFRPDVVGLQELKTTDERFPADEIEKAGYCAIWHGQKSWNGVALLSRVGELHETRRCLPDDPDPAQSRYIEAAVSGILVGNMYAPNGNPWPGPKFDYKLAWLDRLKTHAQALVDNDVPAVLIGDYNVIPTDFDIYDPKGWKKDALLQPQSRAAYAKLLGQGWTDAIRARFPDDKVYTFWDYFRQHWQRNAGLRIDHLLLSGPLAPRLLDAGVHTWVRAEAGASDHAPAWVELDVPAAKRSPRKAVAQSTAAASVAKALRKVAKSPAKRVKAPNRS